MNLFKLYAGVGIFLAVCTYNAEGGIILLLLLKIIMLKGALFFGMPIALGSFLLGQGMGFFGGTMFGGYTMLGAANKYFGKHKEIHHSFPKHRPHFIHSGPPVGWGWNNRPIYGAPHAAHSRPVSYGGGWGQPSTHYHTYHHHEQKIHAAIQPPSIWSKISSIPEILTSKIKAKQALKQQIYPQQQQQQQEQPHWYGDPAWAKPDDSGWSHGQNPMNTYYETEGTQDQKVVAHTSPDSHLNVQGGGDWNKQLSDLMKAAELAVEQKYKNGIYGSDYVKPNDPNYSQYSPTASKFESPDSTNYNSYLTSSGDSSSGYNSNAGGGAAGYNNNAPQESYGGYNNNPSADSPPSQEGYGQKAPATTQEGYSQQQGPQEGYSSSSEQVSAAPAQESYGQPPLEGPPPAQEGYQTSQAYTDLFNSMAMAGYQMTPQEGGYAQAPLEANPGGNYGQPSIYSIGQQQQAAADSYQSAQQRQGEESRESLKKIPAPNSILESYLEQKLKEEIRTQKNEARKRDAAQLIQLLRQVYMQELVDSLGSSSNDRTGKSVPPFKAFPDVPNSTTAKPRLQVTTLIPSSVVPPPAPTVPSPLASAGYPLSSEDESIRFVPLASPFVLQKRSMSMEPYNSHPPQHHHHQHHHNPHQYYQGPRSRRQAISDAQALESFKGDITKFFLLVSLLDQDKCLQKLVCDVHTKPSTASFTPYEQNIVVTFKVMNAILPLNVEDSTTNYRKAAKIGELGKNLGICAQAYPTCSYSTDQIITMGNQVAATPEGTGAATLPVVPVPEEGAKAKSSAADEADLEADGTENKEVRVKAPRFTTTTTTTTTTQAPMTLMPRV